MKRKEACIELINFEWKINGQAKTLLPPNSKCIGAANFSCGIVNQFCITHFFPTHWGHFCSCFSYTPVQNDVLFLPRMCVSIKKVLGKNLFVNKAALNTFHLFSHVVSGQKFVWHYVKTKFSIGSHDCHEVLRMQKGISRKLTLKIM